MREAVEECCGHLASPKTVGHSPKPRLVVTMIEVRSFSRLMRWKSSWPPALRQWPEPLFRHWDIRQQVVMGAPSGFKPPGTAPLAGEVALVRSDDPFPYAN